MQRGDGCDLAEAIDGLKAASLEASAAIGARLTELLAELGSRTLIPAEDFRRTGARGASR